MEKYTKPILTLFFISLISSIILSFAYTATRPAFSAQQEKIKSESMLNVLSSATIFEDIEYNYENIQSFAKGLNESGETVGYTIQTSSTGYSGQISMIIGVNTDGIITGIDILSHTETPGLGANAIKDTFKEQYKDKIGPFEVVKTGATNDTDIDALTGATITSRAVTKGVNYAIEFFNSVKGDI